MLLPLCWVCMTTVHPIADMFSIVSFFILLAVLVCPSQEHPIGNATCSLRFQEHIQKAIEIKKDCGYAVFNDCCQPLLLFSKLATGTFEIEDPCHVSTPFAPAAHNYVYARCDMDTDNGGWLVIQRRVKNGTVDFYRDWSDYEEGFGDLEGEFWYGLHKIHCLTNSASMELRMDMEDESGNKITWTYQEFRVEGPENKYKLHIGGGEGTPGTEDVMATQNNMYFSTKDRENDQWSGHCAQTLKGGWWYYNCGLTNPNGVHDSGVRADSRISARTNRQYIYYPNFEIKIRPKSCTLIKTSASCT